MQTVAFWGNGIPLASAHSKRGAFPTVVPPHALSSVRQTEHVVYSAAGITDVEGSRVIASALVEFTADRTIVSGSGGTLLFDTTRVTVAATLVVSVISQFQGAELLITGLMHFTQSITMSGATVDLSFPSSLFRLAAETALQGTTVCADAHPFLSL